MTAQFSSILPAVSNLITRRTTVRLAVLGLAMVASTGVSADGFNSGIINFDYNSFEAGYSAYGPGRGAIGSNGDLWNSVSSTYYGGEPKPPLSLFNTAGTLTSAKWSLAGGGGILAPIGGTYGKLFDVSVAFSSASLTGLTPNQSYDLRLFGVYWDGLIRVNGVDFTMPGIRFGNVDSLNVGSQYDLHTVKADASGALAFVPVSFQFDTPYISSWQLTPVPEPSIISLAGLALLVIAGRQRWV